MAILTALGALWIFTLGSGAAPPDRIILTADGSGGDIDLDADEATAKAALDGLPDTGTSTVELPPGIDGSLPLDALTITTTTPGEATIAGTATLFADQAATVTLTASWADGATSPTVTVVATLDTPSAFALTDLNPEWTTGATDPSFSSVSFTLDGTTAVTAGIDIGAISGTNTATNLGVSTAELTSTITADLTTLTTGGATGSLAMTGSLDVTTPPGFPSFVTATATDTAWNASIAFDATATTPTLATTIEGQVTIARDDIGLPTTPLTLTGAGTPAGTVLSASLPSPLVEPLTLGTTIASPVLEIDLRTDPATVAVTGDETLGGAVTVPADAAIVLTEDRR